MADNVRRRFTAARAGVMMAIFGLAAGLGIKTGGVSDEPVEFDSAAAKTLTIGKSKVGSGQIKDRSILYRDLKAGQVPSFKEYKAFTAAVQGNFVKLNPANFMIKGEAYVKGES